MLYLWSIAYYVLRINFCVLRSKQYESMPFDYLTITSIRDEFERRVVGGRVQEVLVPAPLAVSLEVYRSGVGRSYLLLSAHPQYARAHLLPKGPNRDPQQQPTLLLLLRKYVRGGIVTGVSQPPYERVLALSIAKRVGAGKHQEYHSDPYFMHNEEGGMEPEDDSASPDDGRWTMDDDETDLSSIVQSLPLSEAKGPSSAGGIITVQLVTEIMGKLSNIVLVGEEIYGGEYTPPPGNEGTPYEGELEKGGPSRGEPETKEDKASMSALVAGLEETLQDILAGQEPAPEFEEYIERRPPGLLFVLTGPSGVGKDVTLEHMKRMGVPFHYVVTVTTRKQRPGEIDGKHYHFVTMEEYERMLRDNELLEHAEIYGNCYGIPRTEVVDPLRRGEDVFMKPDVQGARKMREIEPDAVFIFLAPPSMEEQAKRLFLRKTEDPQELAARLKVAREEMHEMEKFDYIVVNRNNRLDETVRQLEAIMIAEKSRVHPRRIRMAE